MRVVMKEVVMKEVVMEIVMRSRPSRAALREDA